MKQSDNQMDKQSDNQKKNDFSRGSVVGNIMKLAVPMTLAQLINVLYNIVDRIYIGMIPENATLSLTGLGLCLPIISIVIAFANLFGMGGAPLCSIERGRGNEKEAEAIMGNSFVMMVAVGILLTVLGLMFKRPMLYLFGASDATIPYADAYVTIYLMGNIFVMTGLGMNSFINSQGFGTVGMMTVLLGAVTNIVLDPVFIFVFHMGVLIYGWSATENRRASVSGEADEVPNLREAVIPSPLNLLGTARSPRLSACFKIASYWLTTRTSVWCPSFSSSPAAWQMQSRPWR